MKWNNLIQIKMYKRLLIPALALALMVTGLSGCIEETLPGGVLLPEGTEFNFGAAVVSSSTKTYYDPNDENNSAATSWRIYWNSTDPLDHIYIYSPQAVSGRNQASYTVTPDTGAVEEGEDYRTKPAPVVKDGAYGVQMGDKESYDFYAMFPASAVKENGGNGKSISATMPADQTPTCNVPMTNEPVRDLKTKADMNCALMIAETLGYSPIIEVDGVQTEAPAVSLRFMPFATMMDITVNGVSTGDPNFNVSSVRISSISIEAFEVMDNKNTTDVNEERVGNAFIAGDFTYNYENKTFGFGDNATNTIYIDTKFANADGSDRLGVLMDKDSKFQVRAFLIPNPAVKGLKVKITTVDSRVLTKTLTTTDANGNDIFKEGQIHVVKLPRIDSRLEIDYSIWLAQLDPTIYISELSLPGSALTFNYLMSDTKMKTQTSTLSQQFAAGARVFQFHTNVIIPSNYPTDISGNICNANGDIVVRSDGTIPEGADLSGIGIGIASSDGANVAKEQGGNWLLEDVIQTLASEMTGNHADEFCVLLISDWISNKTQANFGAYYARISDVLAKFGDLGVAAPYVDANTRIQDVKGKIILKMQLNGREDLGFTGTWGNLEEAYLWTNIYTEEAEDKVFYSHMPFGKVPQISEAGTSSSVLAGNPHMNYIYAERAKPMENMNAAKANASAVPAAYATNYLSDQHRNFSMTYLGGVGSGTNNSSDSPRYVAKTLNNAWLTYIAGATQDGGALKEKPFGWVLCNLVGGDEASTAEVITTVVEHNTAFALARHKGNATPVILVPETRIELSAAAVQEITFNVTAAYGNIEDVTMTQDANSKSWFTASLVNGVVTYSATENGRSDSRTAILTFSIPGGQNVEVTIVQDAALVPVIGVPYPTIDLPCTTVYDTRFTVTVANGSVENVTWAKSQDANWLNVSYESGVVTYSARKNPDSNNTRTATVTFSIAGGTDVVVTFTQKKWVEPGEGDASYGKGDDIIDSIQ